MSSCAVTEAAEKTYGSDKATAFSRTGIGSFSKAVIFTSGSVAISNGLPDSSVKPLIASRHEWLREIRRKITAEFDHDQQRIGDYLRLREEELGDRIVRTQERAVPAKR